MAERFKVWQRGHLSSITFEDKDSVQAPLSFPAGTTLLRLRWTYSLTSHQDIPFTDLPAQQVVIGTTLLDAAVLPPPPDPLADPDEDWLWYEGCNSAPYQHTIISPTYVTLQGPVDGGHRDSHAERIFQFGDPALCWSFNQAHGFTFTPTWFLQVTYSALLLTAP